ncbi:MAG: S8 family serine peptidase [candidate division Zixibacteria bacterium]|nr:S8 family serine peptidase [candidate division Zixibacteria bacterium]
MINRKILCLIIVILLLTISNSYSQFYYSAGKQIPLQIDSSLVTFKFTSETTQELQQGIINSIDRISSKIDDDYLIHDFVACSLIASNNYYNFIDSLRQIPGIYRVEPYYLCNGKPLLMGESFFVRFKEGVSRKEIDSLNDIYNVEISGMPAYRNNVCYLRITDSTEYSLLDLANIYYELQQTLNSHPNFGTSVIPDSYKSYDYYNEYQWHTKKVIGFFNDSSVWDFAGLDKTIKVALLDDGFRIHPDLPAERVLPGWNFVDETDNVLPDFYNAHGMACAGIIAASHTTDSTMGSLKTSGVISLNSNVNIIPLKIHYFECGDPIVPESVYAEAIYYAFINKEADIISCSWHAENIYDNLTIATRDAKTSGRHFRGCPVVFSSGNSYNIGGDTVCYPGCLEYCLAVGAIDSNDYRWDYSCFDSTLDLVAPSGDMPPKKGMAPIGDVWTLDQSTIYGVNPSIISTCPSMEENDQWMYCKFGGTSAACPVVSGIASLLISKDTLLTADQVYDILRHSAVKDLDWGTLPDTPHVEYGYGRVDAFRAILSISHGDVDNDDQFSISDITALIDFLYQTHTPPFPSILLGDCNCDSVIDISDITHLINYCYLGGPPPVKPCYVFELSAPPRLE